MCTDAACCRVLRWEEARTLALSLHPGQPRPLIQVERRWWAFGSQSGRCLRFARFVPACIVPHEVAHLTHPHDGHGWAWAAEYRRLAHVAGIEV